MFSKESLKIYAAEKERYRAVILLFFYRLLVLYFQLFSLCKGLSEYSRLSQNLKGHSKQFLNLFKMVHHSVAM